MTMLLVSWIRQGVALAQEAVAKIVKRDYS